MTNPILDRARRLSALGFSVIPLDHPEDPIANDPAQRGKVPAIKWAPWQEARPTDDNLRAWFGNGHQRNIGIVTGAISDIVFVDTDSLEADAFADTELPPTPIRTVTSKGSHRGYRHPGKPVPNKARIRDGVDVRGDGGYVVGPGSLHASGHVYREWAPWPISLADVPVFDPAWLGIGTTARSVEAPAVVRTVDVHDRDRLRARVRAYLERTPGAVAGQRGDEHTFQVCCRVARGFLLRPDEARDLLREWNIKCQPPWTERELDAKIDGALKYGRESMGGRLMDRPFVPTATERSDQNFPLTDSGNAEAFAAAYGSRVRYDFRRKRWLVWAGHRWMPDADAEVDRLAKELLRRRQAHAFSDSDPDRRKAGLKWALNSESRRGREAMLNLARSERPIADKGDAWDPDPWLLCVPNGVIDLRTGDLRDGHPDDRITRATAVAFDPSATCELWERVVSDIFNADHVLATYTQRALGYSLTGNTSEQCLWAAQGGGSNGKGTLLNTVLACVGDYGYQMPFATVLGGRKDAPTNDLAALEGRRFVLASEANDGVRFDEARIKALTGCDRITARFLYSEFFEFTPVAKFWLAVNHKPVVRDDSHAFWRRIRLLPFERTFPINPTLDRDLRGEAPGILAWLVRGALLWQAEGLGSPSAIVDATAAYRRDSDALGDFLADVCVVETDAQISGADLFRGYLVWAERQGLTDRERLTQTGFGRKVGERFRKAHTNRGAIYHGVAMRHQ